MTLKTEYIEAKTPQELTEYLNRFLEHLDQKYNDVPAVVMNPITRNGKVGAYVFYQVVDSDADKL
jgi:hypothetical protein